MRGLAIALMIVVNLSVGEEQAYAPLRHAAWHGLTLADVVFPTFLFLVGAALCYSLDACERAGNHALLRKVLIRTTVLFACGYLLSWFPFVRADEAGDWMLVPVGHTRIPGVLQRIALCYGAAALVVHYGGRAAALAYCGTALLGYWWLLQACGDYSPDGNAVLRLDRYVLGASHLYHDNGPTFDPEGILSTVPAVVNVLAGYLTMRLVRARGTGGEPTGRLVLTGVACILVAVAWNRVFPINKQLWTSSYALCTVGIDQCVLAMLIWAIDVAGLRGPTRFLAALGRNALTIYVLSEAGAALLDTIRVGDGSLSEWLYERGFQSWAGDRPGSLLYALAFLLACWLVACAMDRRHLYLRV